MFLRVSSHLPGSVCMDESVMRPLETVSLTDVYTALGTQLQGLSHAEAARRLARYGQNTLHQVATASLARKLLANFTHLMALLLWDGGLIGFLAQTEQTCRISSSPVPVWLPVLGRQWSTRRGCRANLARSRT